MCAFSIFGKKPAALPGTVITIEELSSAIGQAINDAFKNYLPQPEESAKAIKEAIDVAGSELSGKLQSATKDLSQGTKQLSEFASSIQGSLKSHVEEIDKTVTQLSQQLGASLAEGADKLKPVFTAHTDGLKGHLEEMDKSIAKLSQQLTASLAEGADKLKPVFTAHAESLKQANQELASQLEKISTLQKNIDEVLQLQKTVEGTISSISASNEFTTTLSALQKHLAESDNLLKTVAKPRNITLVESVT